ncbi:MAG TPA: MarR family transcriptional regulator [Acidimicrobiales bacterium]|nr:MarR family transcriptional regulator [Acidimicrobiales bacterium]
MSPSSPLPFDPIAEAMRQWRSHGWGDAAPGVGVVTSAVRVQQILAGRAEAVVRPFGLTFARYEVLMLLLFSARGEMPLGKIGERLQVGAASVTNAIDRLERDRLVRRRPNPDDGRGVLAVLTARGRALAHEVTDALNEALFTTVELSSADADALFALLATLRRRAGDFD